MDQGGRAVIEETASVDPRDPGGIKLAPLTRDTFLPLALRP